MAEAIINVRGERVGLGPLRRDLVGEYQRWYNDVSTSETLGLSWPTTLEQELATFERRVANPAEVYFTVYELETTRPVGVANLYDVDARHSRASFGVTIGVASTGARATGPRRRS